MTERCDNCRFWHCWRQDATEGTCRRRPPANYSSTTTCDWWCGEWLPKKNLSVDETAALLARAVLDGHTEAVVALRDRLIELGY